MLRVELSDLKGEDFDVSLTGFDEKELARLFAEEDGAGRGAARGCDGPINLGVSDPGCTRQAVTESYWTTLSDGAR